MYHSVSWPPIRAKWSIKNDCVCFEREFDVVRVDTTLHNIMQTLMSTGIKSIKFLVPNNCALTVRVVIVFCYPFLAVVHRVIFLNTSALKHTYLTRVSLSSGHFQGQFYDPGSSLILFVHHEPKNHS